VQLSETANTIGYMIEKAGLAGGFKTNYSSVKWNAKYVLVFPVNGGSYTEYAFMKERLEKLKVNVFDISIFLPLFWRCSCSMGLPVFIRLGPSPLTLLNLSKMTNN
jgi:hypothetical protein